MDGKLEGPGLRYGPVATEGGVLTDGLHRQVVGSQLLEHEVVHSLGSAEEEGHVPDVHIFLHQGGGDKAVLIAGALLVAEDVDNLQPLLRQGIQLRPEGDAGFVPCAVEQGHLIVLVSLHHAFCHGEEGGNTGAAGNADNMLFIPEGLVVELTGGLRHGKAVAGFGLLVQVTGEETGLLHTQHQLVFQCLTGTGGDGVGTAYQAFTHLGLEGHILSRTEEGEGRGVQAAEGKLPHPGSERPYCGQLHLHGAGVEGLGQLIGAVGLGQGGVGAVGQGLPAVGHQLLEPQHIHKAEDLFLEVHLISPPA